jgi:hypothetical protein
MSIHKHNSWGRTRRPKNITGVDGTEASCTTIIALSALDIAGTGSLASPSNKVYTTENQRYMHIHCSGSSNNVSNVYTYLYATQQWSELKRFDFKTGTDRESIVVSDNEHVVVDIKGSDLVAVAGTGNPMLAFSTF